MATTSQHLPLRQSPTATTDDGRVLSPSQLPPVPSSPAMSYASTANPLAAYQLPPPPPPRHQSHATMTKADLEASQVAYVDLIASAKAYRQALAAIGTAASAFGSALEACARLKEARAPAISPTASGDGGANSSGMPPSMTASFIARAPNQLSSSCTADQLLAAAGLQHLIANHHQILGETIYRSFEVPLLHELDKWRHSVEDEQARYTAAATAQGREIRRLEKEGVKMHKTPRRRDVAQFRTHLVELTAKLDGLTTLHADHSRALLRDCQDTSVGVLDAACSIARAEVDIFESLARKGWTGGGLEDLLERGTDLFASDEPIPSAADLPVPADSSRLFSILPPKSILADSASETTRPGHHRADSLLVDPDETHYQSLARALSPTKGGAVGIRSGGGGVDSESIFNQPRGARPFSPEPIPVDPGELPMGGGSSDPGASGDHEAETIRTDLSSSPVQLEEPTPRASRMFRILHDNSDNDDADDDSSVHKSPWRDERSPADSAFKRPLPPTTLPSHGSENACD
ncbi:hypothetical protein MCOR09_007784 [Pyricularia oryzae]|nr:hypothetical protein MCOR09_007784 [Pyricularia oryzae]